jgi:glucosylceramidase
MLNRNSPLKCTILIGLIHLISGQFIEYWVSEPALNKMFVQYLLGSFGTDVGNNPYTINIDSNQKYQQMDGYGASLTDASAWLFFYKLSDAKRAELLEKLFGKTGMHLSLLRQPIGASDFRYFNFAC